MNDHKVSKSTDRGIRHHINSQRRRWGSWIGVEGVSESFPFAERRATTLDAGSSYLSFHHLLERKRVSKKALTSSRRTHL
jgi:hypothetical protein